MEEGEEERKMRTKDDGRRKGDEEGKIRDGREVRRGKEVVR